VSPPVPGSAASAGQSHPIAGETPAFPGGTGHDDFAMVSFFRKTVCFPYDKHIAPYLSLQLLRLAFCTADGGCGRRDGPATFKAGDHVPAAFRMARGSKRPRAQRKAAVQIPTWIRRRAPKSFSSISERVEAAGPGQPISIGVPPVVPGTQGTTSHQGEEGDGRETKVTYVQAQGYDLSGYRWTRLHSLGPCARRDSGKPTTPGSVFVSLTARHVDPSFEGAFRRCIGSALGRTKGLVQQKTGEVGVQCQ